ncbi:MAG: hypothetical protein IPN77_27910 [Sandaracinaceae bacterium]|nr:hypothetical protein [Sandaracinaceae bacterium]
MKHALDAPTCVDPQQISAPSALEQRTRGLAGDVTDRADACLVGAAAADHRRLR